jgi:hypothetical protein
LTEKSRARQTPTTQQQQPFSRPTNDPNPSAPSVSSSLTSTTPSSPTVTKGGGTNGFGVTHFYPDSPTGVKWYMTSSYQTHIQTNPRYHVYSGIGFTKPSFLYSFQQSE